LLGNEFWSVVAPSLLAQAMSSLNQARCNLDEDALSPSHCSLEGCRIMPRPCPGDYDPDIVPIADKQILNLHPIRRHGRRRILPLGWPRADMPLALILLHPSLLSLTGGHQIEHADRP